MAIILLHGSAIPWRIRTKLLNYGQDDTVIGLPGNLFSLTGIPSVSGCSACKKPDDVLFINAVEHFDYGKPQNCLIDDHIVKIVNPYQRHKKRERYFPAGRVEQTARA